MNPFMLDTMEAEEEEVLVEVAWVVADEEVTMHQGAVEDFGVLLHSAVEGEDVFEEEVDTDTTRITRLKKKKLLHDDDFNPWKQHTYTHKKSTFAKFSIHSRI